MKTPVQTPPDSLEDKPWIGPKYEETRILVLGESWYGDWGGAQNSDAGYVQAYLDGTLTDRMYTKMANATGLDRKSYWNSIAFTNFVIWAGTKRTDRPTPQMYRSSIPRLRELLQQLKPRGVWILGKEQAEHSAPVIKQAGIPFDVSIHPTSYGVTRVELSESWSKLTTALAVEAT